MNWQLLYKPNNYCMAKFNLTLFAEVMEQRLVDDRTNISLVISQMTNVTHREGCGCLPGCTAINYEKSQSSSELTVKLDVREDYLAGRDVMYFKYGL